MDLILILLFLMFFVGLPIFVYKQVRKNFRLRNLQLKNAEMQHQQYTNPGPTGPAQIQPPGWYPDPSGAPGNRYWDGTGWTPHQSRAS
jgi:hypothetical protein